MPACSAAPTASPNLSASPSTRRRLRRVQPEIDDGDVQTVLPPAPNLRLRVGRAAEACAKLDRDQVVTDPEHTDRENVDGCRAEMPSFSDENKATRPCAVSKFAFVDEFFGDDGGARGVDLSRLALDAANDTRREEVEGTSPGAAPQLQDIYRWSTAGAADAKPRSIAREERMLLEAPTPEADGPEPYGSTALAAKVSRFAA
ncbi:hypothetical protein M885DRAFT_558268 [Pelagophyceae sp. CCMP2097]|nr:hypothetical protein M885DRAFT_558268 [Pelagophyceae sp. CCMP2097]